MTDQLPETIIEVARPDPQLIQELFDKDPLDLSDTDIDMIILSFRQDRADYLQPKEAKPAKGKAAAAVKAPLIETQMSMDDLGL